MERAPGFAEQVPAAEQVGPVVDVATVGRASAGADDAGVPELRQVVRDQVLRLPDQLHELADPAIAATELADQLPSQRIAEQREDLRRLRRSHIAITSVRIDSLQVDGCGTGHRRQAHGCEHAAMRRYVWTKDDPPGMEQCELTVEPGALVARSVAIGSAPVPYRLDLELTTDWVTQRLSLTALGDRWARMLVLERNSAGVWTGIRTTDGSGPPTVGDPRPGAVEPEGIPVGASSTSTSSGHRSRTSCLCVASASTEPGRPERSRWRG